MTCDWGGHIFTVYDLENTRWNPIAGVYIFASLRQEQWRAVYIGQTNSFAGRIPNHEQRSAAIRNGATHVHARAVSDFTQRQSIERSLIQAYRPILNSM